MLSIVIVIAPTPKLLFFALVTPILLPSTLLALPLLVLFVALARGIDPNLRIEAQYKIAGVSPDVGASADPLRQLLTVSFDEATFDPRQQAAVTMFAGVSELMGARERDTLVQYAMKLERKGDLHLPMGRVNWAQAASREQALAELFASHVAPNGRHQKSRELKDMFAKPRAFFSKVNNAMRGRGYQTGQDVLDRVASGAITERRSSLEAFDALHAPDKKNLPQAYDQMKAAIGKMTDADIERTLRKQHEGVRSIESHVRSRLWIANTINPFAVEGGLAYKHKRLQKGLLSARRFRVMLEVERNLRKGDGRWMNPKLVPGTNPSPETPPPVARIPLGGQLPPQNDNVVHVDFAQGLQDRLGANGEIYAFRKRPQDIDGQHFDYAIELTHQHEPARERVLLAAAKDAATADIMMRAYERVGTSPHAPTPPSVALVNQLNGTSGLASQIAALRGSFQVDTELDAAIGRGDIMAFVYPLKNGEIVWHNAETNSWSAGTRAAFVDQATMAGSATMLAAARVIEQAAPAAPQVIDRDGVPTATRDRRALPEPSFAPSYQSAPQTTVDQNMVADARTTQIEPDMRPIMFHEGTENEKRALAHIAALSPDALAAQIKNTEAIFVKETFALNRLQLGAGLRALRAEATRRAPPESPAEPERRRSAGISM